jgi:hypothetical protein
MKPVVVKIPLPIAFEISRQAAVNVPTRRSTGRGASSGWDGAGCVVGVGFICRCAIDVPVRDGGRASRAGRSPSSPS